MALRTVEGKKNLKKVFSEMNYISHGKTEKQIKVGESLGKVYVTAYCPCEKCSDPHGHATASGKKAKPNHTIAVDAYDPIVPIDTKVVIKGNVYTVEDTGDLHKYGNEFDIFYEHHNELDSWGRRKVEVFVTDKDGKIKKNLIRIKTMALTKVLLIYQAYPMREEMMGKPSRSTPKASSFIT